MENKMKKTIKNIKVNYIFLLAKFLGSTQGIWMIYLASKGYSLFQIGLLEGIFHVTSFIMETPTGAIADLFGRKISRLIGVGLMILSNILMITSNNFALFIVSFVLCALSYNCESGAGEALVYDSLVEENEEEKFTKISGHNEVIYQVTSVVALVVGGAIADIQFTYVYLFAIALNVVTLIIGLFFNEPTMIKEKAKETENDTIINSIKNQYVTSYQAVKGNKRLIYLILLSSIVATSIAIAFYYIQIAFSDMGLSVFEIGIYLAIGSLFAATGAVLADRIDVKYGEEKILRLIPIMASVSILGFYFMRFAIIPLIIINMIDSILFVAMRNYINVLIESDKRATILSFESMVFSFFMIILFPLFGLLSDHIGLNYAFVLLGGVILTLALFNLRVKK